MGTETEPLTLHRYRRINQAYVELLTDEVSLMLMHIPAGELVIGNGARRVTLSPFLMGRYPVTQAQWRIVAGYPKEKRELKPEPARFKGDALPVERVSWGAATEFCQRLAAKTGKPYRLPSETEWEYACRAETQTDYHYGDRLTPELANYGKEVGQTSAVGSYSANRWGLYDMHANVWEWCQDQYHSSYEEAPEDGSAWIPSDESENRRVLRGGSWYDFPEDCRWAIRNGFAPVNSNGYVGFRVVCGLAR
ncbi:MAG: formylglycine-generating enzyme family protein [Cyanobacteria bacterium P01_D01_bin.6]